MRAVRASAREWEIISNHRETTIEFKRLLQGEPDAPENFELSLVRMRGRYTTPAHHHNFEQVRLALVGGMGYGAGRVQPEGTVGYFPEGSFYAQDVEDGQLTMLLQCGGASGAGFLSYDQLRAGARVLSQSGRFEDGLYLGRPGANQPPKDGYEAIWEHVRGREIDYPEARYEDHLIMTPDAFLWRQTGVEGVAVKHLATVTERRMMLEYYRIAPGAARPFGPRAERTLLFVVAGCGKVGAETLGPRDAAELTAGEAVEVTAAEPLILFAMTLPKVPPVAEPAEHGENNAAA